MICRVQLFFFVFWSFILSFKTHISIFPPPSTSAGLGVGEEGALALAGALVMNQTIEVFVLQGVPAQFYQRRYFIFLQVNFPPVSFFSQPFLVYYGYCAVLTLSLLYFAPICIPWFGHHAFFWPEWQHPPFFVNKHALYVPWIYTNNFTAHICLFVCIFHTLSKIAVEPWNSGVWYFFWLIITIHVQRAS